MITILACKVASHTAADVTPEYILHLFFSQKRFCLFCGAENKKSLIFNREE
jgi:ribonuclease BN (tRNA processing enzyme)